LWCRADGNPAPSTRCSRESSAGASRGQAAAAAAATPAPAAAPGGSSRAVSRADAGRYLCRATNKHGSATRSVLVTVECECRTGLGAC
ncbi:ICAM1 protein, partial [Bucco capensis]|nr:ICAM1 protein [Bucco capensis]